MAYEIAPFRKVKANYTEFLAAMKALETATKARTESIWPGFSFGGIFPQANQYGFGEILPFFSVLTPTIFGSNTFVRRYTAPGSWTNIFSYTVPTDQVHSFAGLAFPEPHFIFNGVRITVADRTYPIIWLEEARAQFEDAKGIAVIFKPDAGQELVVPEKTSIQIQGYQERGTSGITHRVVPLGLASYRKRDNYVNTQAN